MALNAHINKKEKENTLATMKRFTQKVRGTGVIQKLKSKKFNERKASTLVLKQKALRKIKNTAERDMLRKMGKIK